MDRFGYRRPTAVWRLLLAFVVLLATTLQVVPRPCGGHSADGKCPASAAAQCCCSCCTAHPGESGGIRLAEASSHGHVPTAVAMTVATDEAVYYERLCGTPGQHLWRTVPMAARHPVGHVSLPSWRVPGLWVTPAPVQLARELPPAALPPTVLGQPERRAFSLLRPPNA